MSNKNFFYYAIILLATVCLIIVPYVALAKESKYTSIKLIIKEQPEVESSINSVMKKLNELARNMEKTAKLYNTINQKAYWESEGKKSFLRYLHSEGYYDATIETEFPETENSIIFYVNGWERYKVKKIILKYAENSNHDINIPDITGLKIKEGDFAVAANVIDSEKVLAKNIEKNNCLLSLEVTHEAIIDNSDDTMIINFIINAGPYATIKSVDFKGLRSVNPDYVKKLIPFKNDQCFRPSFLQEAQGSLQKTGLFAIINTEIPDHTDNKGKVPIVFDLKEQKHRSVKAGFSYGTDLGFGTTLGWNHKNFFGNGETVKTEISGNQKEQIIDLEFTKPFYKQDNQTLKIGLSGENTTSKAYDNREGMLSVGIERKLTNIWTAGISGKYSYSVVKETQGSKDFSFLSIPLFIKRDTRDNILNTRKGLELQFKTEPFFPTKTGARSFFKNEVIAAKYTPFRVKFDPVIAIKVSAGVMSGTKSAKIPANERFYTGGVGSVRGYAYQLAGPIDQKNHPIGGRSMILSNLELRTKIKNDIGLVVFFDSGNVFSSTTPALGKKMFHGFGAGMRYFTDFGPLRLDIGFPVKPRKKVDKAFQLYFGIGQNF